MAVLISAHYNFNCRWSDLRTMLNTWLETTSVEVFPGNGTIEELKAALRNVGSWTEAEMESMVLDPTTTLASLKLNRERREAFMLDPEKPKGPAVRESDHNMSKMISKLYGCIAVFEKYCNV